MQIHLLKKNKVGKELRFTEDRRKELKWRLRRLQQQLHLHRKRCSISCNIDFWEKNIRDSLYLNKLKDRTFCL